MSRSLLTVWRRQHRDGKLGDKTPPSFIPLRVTPKGKRHAAPLLPC
ncbi:hypothetical protein [Allgaiera indica]|nr:hypothetical protein [Allgaiera indica]